MEDLNENLAKEKEFLFPSYGCDERTKDGFVTVGVWIRGFKTSSDIVLKGILPKKVRKPANAKVDVTFEDWSFCVTVHGESGDMKWTNYRLKIKKLPREIIPDQSIYEVKDEQIILHLRKKEDRSWIPAIYDGLETAEESDSSDDEDD